MRQILQICRDHGRPPAWWDGLDRGDQALLRAESRLRAQEQRRADREAQRSTTRRR